MACFENLMNTKNCFYFCFSLFFYYTQISLASDWDKDKAYSFLSNSIMEERYQCLCSNKENFTPPFISIPQENFSSMVILELLVDTDFNLAAKFVLAQKIKNERRVDGLYTFFKDKNLLPPDVDCIALAYTALLKFHGAEDELLMPALSALLKNVNEEGLIEVYIDPQRSNRIDPVVCANVLYFACLCGKHEEIKQTENFIHNTLITKSYKQGTRYYPSACTFLYMVSRLLDFPCLHGKFAFLIYENLTEHIFANNALELAMYIICAKKLGIENKNEQEQLAKLQDADGGWPACTFYKTGKSSDYFGSREITTAFAIRALHH